MPSRWIPKLRLLMMFWSFAFSIALCVFVFATNELFAAINDLSLRFTPELPLMPESSERFWLALTTSLMITLIYMSTKIALDVNRNLNLMTPFLLSKLVSTLSFLVFFFLGTNHFAYLIGAVTDGSIFIVTAAVYSRARRETSYRGWSM